MSYTYRTCSLLRTFVKRISSTCNYAPKLSSFNQRLLIRPSCSLLTKNVASTRTFSTSIANLQSSSVRRLFTHSSVYPICANRTLGSGRVDVIKHFRRSYASGGQNMPKRDDNNLLYIGLLLGGGSMVIGYFSGELFPDHGDNEWKAANRKAKKDAAAEITVAEVVDQISEEETFEEIQTEEVQAEDTEVEEVKAEEVQTEEVLVEAPKDVSAGATEEAVQDDKEPLPTGEDEVTGTVETGDKVEEVLQEQVGPAEIQVETVEIEAKVVVADTSVEASGQEAVEQVKEASDSPPQSKGQKDTTEAETTTAEIKEIAEAVTEKKDEPSVIPVAASHKELPPLPQHVPYIIIGAGTASHSACRAIRKREPTAKILVIGEEEVLPYMRPPLSKELWFSNDPAVADTLRFEQWNGKQRSVFFEKDSYYVDARELTAAEKGGIAVLSGNRVLAVNAKEHEVQLKNGSQIKYDKLLLATGGQPRNIPVFESAPAEVKSKTTLFRTVADFRKLDKVTKAVDSVAIIGGGFLGSELACALAHRGKESSLKVTQIFPEKGNMAKVLPQYLSSWTTEKVKSEGVNVLPEKQINGVAYENGRVAISLQDGEKVEADHVIVCVGLEPNVELAKSAGLEVDHDIGGFRVNSELEARSDIWVAGDAACFYDIHLGRRRVEHHDHAVVSGRLAGENMTGAKKSYWHQSMFWSDLGPDVGYEAIGIVDSTLPSVGVWAKATEKDTPKAVVEATGESVRSKTEAEAESTPVTLPEKETTPVDVETVSREQESQFGKGVVFYMKGKRVVGILLWNVFSRMPVARQIIKEGKDQDSLHELAKLFELYKE